MPKGSINKSGAPKKTEVSGVRLQKVLSEAGIASRRASEQLIKEQRVLVNRAPAILGQRVDPAKDRIEVDGQRLHLDKRKRYLVLNKPVGVITTSSDPQKRTTVLDLIGEQGRVFPVGRLDTATEGLLLLTNDGELANRLAHPSYAVPKTYVAEVTGMMGPAALRRLKEGVKVDRGKPARADDVRIIQSRGGSRQRSVVEVTVHEGRKHIVRLMLEAVGHPVVRLTRTQIGPLRLGRLAAGTYRQLTPAEVSSLYGAVDL